MTPVHRRGPLAHPAFRTLWAASLVANIALWMQNVSAASLMTSLTSSAAMVALVQTATSLPIFLFGLPGGVLADRVDLRRWLMFTQGWMLVASVLLCVATMLGGLQPWLILALTFALATGNALNSPAWQTAAAEAVPRELLPAATAMNSAAYNVARVVGPALAGLLTAALGPAVVFLVNALCFGLVVIAVWRWRPERTVSHLPPEALWAGMLGALRYVRHAPVVRVTLLRAGLTLGCGSSVWALLPVLARDHLHLGPTGYGLLLGALGAGAVAAALSLSRLREYLDVNTQIGGAGLVFAAVTAAVAFIHQPGVVWCLLVVAGFAWIAAMSNCTAVLQTSIPGWVRARAAAVYILTAHGAMAVGGVVWGLAALHFGVPATLWLSAAAGALAVIATHRLRLVLGSQEALAPISMPEAPAGDVDAAAGPVAVELHYHVQTEQRDAFLRAIRAVGAGRRRNGASFWRLYRVIGKNDEFVERFLVSSWLDYQRQRQRDTVADREAKRSIWSMLVSGTSPGVRRYVAVDDASMPEESAPSALDA